jgi:hypothetical protein
MYHILVVPLDVGPGIVVNGRETPALIAHILRVDPARA